MTPRLGHLTRVVAYTVLAFVLLTCAPVLLRHIDETRSFEEPAQIEAWITSKAPIGGSYLDANSALRWRGFACEPHADSTWSCDRRHALTWFSSRRWHITLHHDDESLLDVTAHTGIIAL